MDTRDNILKVAFNLFLQKTYKDVSLNEIVDKIGLTKGAFYHYFQSKEELFTEIVEKYLVIGQAQVYNTIPRDNLKSFITTYLERIVSFVDNFKQTIDNVDASKGISLFNIMFDALRLTQGFDNKVHQLHKEEREIWVEVIQNAKKSGEIKSTMSDMLLARTFISINDGIGLHLILEGRYDDIPGELFTLWMGFYNTIKN